MRKSEKERERARKSEKEQGRARKSKGRGRRERERGRKQRREGKVRREGGGVHIFNPVLKIPACPCPCTYRWSSVCLFSSVPVV